MLVADMLKVYVLTVMAKLDPRELLEVHAGHRVDFITFGATAVGVHGSCKFISELAESTQEAVEHRHDHRRAQGLSS